MIKHCPQVKHEVGQVIISESYLSEGQVKLSIKGINYSLTDEQSCMSGR